MLDSLNQPTQILKYPFIVSIIEHTSGFWTTGVRMSHYSFEFNNIVLFRFPYICMLQHFDHSTALKFCYYASLIPFKFHKNKLKKSK